VPGRRLHPHPDRLLRRAAGFEDAITAAFPAAVVRRFVVHLVRNALRPVARRDAAQVAAGLCTIYTAPTPGGRLRRPGRLRRVALGHQVPQPPGSSRTPGRAFTPFLAFSPAVRKLLYTTNSRSR
jgi:putative transposase